MPVHTFGCQTLMSIWSPRAQSESGVSSSATFPTPDMISMAIVWLVAMSSWRSTLPWHGRDSTKQRFLNRVLVHELSPEATHFDTARRVALARYVVVCRWRDQNTVQSLTTNCSRRRQTGRRQRGHTSLTKTATLVPHNTSMTLSQLTFVARERKRS